MLNPRINQIATLQAFQAYSLIVPEEYGSNLVVAPEIFFINLSDKNHPLRILDITKEGLSYVDF